MNQAHLHLLITHLPIFGSALGSLVLIQALLTKSEQAKIAAYNLFIISSIGAGIAYLSGEGAEDAMEKILGVSENTIEEHEDSAKAALISLIVLGAASLAGFFIILKKYSFSGTFALVILFTALISFGLVAWTGYLGGQIRHAEEISSGQPPQDQAEQDEEDDEYEHD